MLNSTLCMAAVKAVFEHPTRVVWELSTSAELHPLETQAAKLNVM